MSRHGTLVVGFVAVLLSTAGAQTPVATTQQTGPAPAFVNLSKASNDYQVGPGDLLDIQVVDHDDLHQTLRISNSGEINFSPVGLVCVANQTAFDVEYAIAQRLRDKDLIKNPEVLVFISDYQAKPIYVSGAVVNPGEFVMSQELTASDAILLAGGLRLDAANEGVVHRRTTQAPPAAAGSACSGAADAAVTTETLKVDLRPMKEGRFFEDAMPLKQGDVIVVPQMRMNPYFVVGEVITPRNFFYQPEQILMVSQAISQAGGPTPIAKMSAGMLVRYDEQGRRSELQVDYAAILTGEQADFPLQPYDIIYIPSSAVKNFAYTTLQMSDAMAMSAIFAAGRAAQLPDRPTNTARNPQ